MTPMLRLVLVLAAGLGLVGAATAQTVKPANCDVRLASEIERSDAQVYLMRLELSVTKRQLAQALARCGEACAGSR
jgi:hypothetical protein